VRLLAVVVIALLGVAWPWEAPSAPPLRLGVASILSPEVARPLYLPLARALGDRLGRPVELVQRFGYGRLNDLLARGELDVAVLCTGGYCDVVNRGGGEPLLVPVMGGSSRYRALLVVRRGSGIGSFTDLEGRTMVFTDPLSLTGFVYPWARLKEFGGARRWLADYFFSRSHDRSLRCVALGLADAACVDSRVWGYLVATRPHTVAGLVVVARSEEFPIAPLVVSKRLSPETRSGFKRALVALSRDGEGQMILAQLGIDGFVEPDPEGYARVLDLFRRVEAEVGREP